MVYVRLARDWTDRSGSARRGGELVDVDAVTLAELEQSGVVASAERSPAGEPAAVEGAGGADEAAGEAGVDEATVAWTLPTDDAGRITTVAWAGPTDAGAERAHWAGPTDDR